MTRSTLSLLILAAALTAFSGTQAHAQDFQIWQRNFGSPPAATGGTSGPGGSESITIHSTRTETAKPKSLPAGSGKLGTGRNHPQAGGTLHQDSWETQQ